MIVMFTSCRMFVIVRSGVFFLVIVVVVIIFLVLVVLVLVMIVIFVFVFRVAVIGRTFLVSYICISTGGKMQCLDLP